MKQSTFRFECDFVKLKTEHHIALDSFSDIWNAYMYVSMYVMKKSTLKFESVFVKLKH